MRHLVTVQEISDIRRIEGADRIEVAHVGGWNVVVGRDLFSAGDLVAFFEIDSLLPADNPIFASFQARGQRTLQVDGHSVVGHVLRTLKLRGVISQGLVMGLDEVGVDSSFVKVGDDLTDFVGVVKWEDPIYVGSSVIGNFDFRFAPSSDAIRVQSLSDHWDEIVKMNWIPTVKVDGTSQTIVNDGGSIRFFSHNREIALDAPGFKIAENAGLVDFMKTHEGWAVQFELAGPKIQKNRLNLPSLRLFVFSVWNSGVKVSREDWDPMLESLAAPRLSSEWNITGSLEEMIKKVSTLRGNVTRDKLDEGVVYHLVNGDKYPAWLDRNAEIKIINNNYLLKNGE